MAGFCCTIGMYGSLWPGVKRLPELLPGERTIKPVAQFASFAITKPYMMMEHASGAASRLIQGATKPLRLANQILDFVNHRQEVYHFIKSFYSTPDAWGAMGSVREEEYPFLQELCQEAASYLGPIVEIGTLFGFATTKIALWKRPDQKLLTVDNYSWNPCGLPPQAHQQLTARVLEYVVQKANVAQINRDKVEFFGHYAEGAPAMVFLDADHSYEETKKDIEWAKSAGAKIICGHDYSEECPGVVQAVDEFGGPKRKVGTLWRL